MAGSREMASVRLDPEIVAALRRLADEREETLSDVMRRGALLGYCPTCQRKTEPEAENAP